MLECLVGYRLSAQTVSRAARELGQEVEGDLSQGGTLPWKGHGRPAAVYGLPLGAPQEDTHHQCHREGAQGGPQAHRAHKLFQ